MYIIAWILFIKIIITLICEAFLMIADNKTKQRFKYLIGFLLDFLGIVFIINYLFVI